MKYNKHKKNDSFKNYGTIKLWLTKVLTDRNGKPYVMTPFGYARVDDDFKPEGEKFAVYDFTVYTIKDEDDKGEYYTLLYLSNHKE